MATLADEIRKGAPTIPVSPSALWRMHVTSLARTVKHFGILILTRELLLSQWNSGWGRSA
jgi:hypothetical protein